MRLGSHGAWKGLQTARAVLYGRMNFLFLKGTLEPYEANDALIVSEPVVEAVGVDVGSGANRSAHYVAIESCELQM
ncbi:hypothetical protein A0H81_05640 [Grifola frondosa]|uniref:Uncharacterized protein n=1 Tax=Grifola frondosa TaxID=5627 RepID=A0A1C7MC80_GRIFR|nr:hypothetical protein A0H81_05640 [Grifola frondosa]